MLMPVLHRHHQFDSRHGVAHHRKLHRGVVADGAGNRFGRRRQRADRAADCGASVRILFRILGRRHAPVGLAAYAAAAISGGDPIKTGIQGFTYDIRTAILPFLFIFNTELLMVDIESWVHLLLVVVSATTAMLCSPPPRKDFF